MRRGFKTHEAIQRIMKKDEDLQWKVVTRLSNGWVRVKTQARERRNMVQEMLGLSFVTWDPIQDYADWLMEVAG